MVRWAGRAQSRAEGRTSDHPTSETTSAYLCVSLTFFACIWIYVSRFCASTAACTAINSTVFVFCLLLHRHWPVAWTLKGGFATMLSSYLQPRPWPLTPLPSINHQRKWPWQQRMTPPEGQLDGDWAGKHLEEPAERSPPRLAVCSRGFAYRKSRIRYVHNHSLKPIRVPPDIGASFQAFRHFLRGHGVLQSQPECSLQTGNDVALLVIILKSSWLADFLCISTILGI